MKPLLFAFLSLALSACATNPRTVELPNGCVLDAAAYDLTLNARAKIEGQKLWSRPLIVRGGAYGDGTERSPGHCYLIYLYPAGANRLNAYDARGTQRVRAYRDDPTDIARHVFPPAATGLWLE